MAIASWLRAGIWVLVMAGVAGCASITPIAYEPQPARIANPKGELNTLILANTVQGCVSEVEFSERLMVVKFVCASGRSGGVGNGVVRLDSVERVSLAQSGEWYRVLVHHRGAEDFAWTSKNLTDMQRMVDAITALSKAHAK